AGAMSISELCVIGKPAILVPSPNVSEDHQTHNAMSLVSKNAAVLVRDAEAGEKLVDEVLKLSGDTDALSSLSSSIKSLARPDAGKLIAGEIMSLIQNSGT
ncbi:MAG: undecaprenyldiphospho-muramoylpentapeptide beta-N-acetylglucosaminyltransferase, partial [Bacteroidota bacterium]